EPFGPDLTHGVDQAPEECRCQGAGMRHDIAKFRAHGTSMALPRGARVDRSMGRTAYARVSMLAGLCHEARLTSARRPGCTLGGACSRHSFIQEIPCVN